MAEIVEPDEIDEEDECPDCEGSGYVVCDFCDGSGKVSSEYRNAVKDYMKRMEAKDA